MKVSNFDLNRAKALHYLLDEAHVGRAATRLNITPAAASNALRRLREEFGDPLLVKQGRGLTRTRMGEELRALAHQVVVSAEKLLHASSRFQPETYRGQIPIALSDHVAALLLPELHKLAETLAPMATLAIAAIPLSVVDWLEQSGGALVSPSGAFAATHAGDALVTEAFYQERYVCVTRHGHPIRAQRWNARTYAGQSHVLVTPRGGSQRSDIDIQLAALGLTRRISRVVPSFALALPLLLRSDLITTVPERYARLMPIRGYTIHPLPITVPPLDMKIVVHPVHANDARIAFTRHLLHTALRLSTGENAREPGVRRR